MAQRYDVSLKALFVHDGDGIIRRRLFGGRVTEHLATEQPDLDRMSLILTGARERLGPILMTALVTGLGLTPIALGSQQAGREIEGPMAIVILGGLGTSTLLNLFVLPSIASFFPIFKMQGQQTRSHHALTSASYS